MTKTKKNLYALIVGIDEYNPNVKIIPGCKFTSLAGCVNDAQKILSYLQAEEGFELHEVVLKNAEATKEAISDNMRTHLAKAVENDVAFFYYSGHGIQEHADRQLWPGETDGRLECLVCYPLEGKSNLLADKELRFLIREIVHGAEGNPKKNPPHMLTIFDCCHSGENTRNGFMTANDTRERRIKCIAPQRQWNQFIFKDDVETENLKSRHLSEILPEGMHVHLSACESDESALEVNGQGVFTSYLINILKRAKGNITYYDLMSQTRHYLNNTFTQKPQLRLPGEDSSGNYATFLNKAINEQPLYGNVIYNQKNGWILDMGSLTGISPRTKRVTITGPDNETFIGKISKILLDETWIKFRPADSPNKKQVYKATLEGILSHPVKIYINNYDGPKYFIKELLEKFQENTRNMVLEEAEANADYTLHVRDFMLFLTKPENDFRPMVKPEPLNGANSIDNIVNYLRHISQWEFVKRLKNPSVYLFNGNPIKIEAFKGQTGAPLTIESNKVDLNFSQKADGNWGGKVALKLTNTTERKLYVSALYLMIEFRVYLKGMDPQVYTLEPGESVWLFNYRRNEITFSVDDLASNYNWPFTEDFFKIIVSTKPFDVSRLEKKELPKPTFIDKQLRSSKKGLDVDFEEKEPKMEGDDWTTQDLTLRFHNPLFNSISHKKLMTMLDEKDMVPFTTRLFFNTDENGVLKWNPKIKIDGLTGSLNDVEKTANDRFRKLHSQLKDQRQNHFNNLPNVITVGDDWLHNESVKNLSAQFSGYYNIAKISGNFESADRMAEELGIFETGKVVCSIGAKEIMSEEVGPVLEKLENWAKKFPDLEWFVHGYDYFPDKPGTSLDQFNEGLIALANQYENLTYLDLRGNLNENQWSSNSLPNQDGFEKLAGAFLSVLTE